MQEVTPLLKALDQRRRDLGLSYDLLSKRCGVSRPTVQRILSGRQAAASFSNILAISDAMGLVLRFDSAVASHKLKREQAERKAKKLVALVQGTSGLEGQAVDRETVASMVEQTTHELLAGSAQTLERRVSDWELLPGETPIDVSGLKRKGIGTRAELNQAEAENVRKAVVKYLAAKPSRRSAPFTLSWVKRLHGQMFGDVWKWAGEFRRENINLGCDWHQVPSRLQSLLDDLVFWEEQGEDFSIQAVRLHHRAVQIHPFLNGNGRWARMLANIWLKRHGHAITAWPEETIGTQSVARDDYLAAIRAADEGDEEPLNELHQRFTSGS